MAASLGMDLEAGGRAVAVALLGGFAAFMAWREPSIGGTRRVPSFAAILAVVAVAVALCPVAGVSRFAPLVLAFAVGLAHFPVVLRVVRTARGVFWSRLGLLCPLLGGWAYSPQWTYEPWTLVLALVVLFEVSWLPLLLRARSQERDRARPSRFACPRCGTIQSRALGKGPCVGCGLFVLVDVSRPDTLPESAHPGPAKSMWLLCPNCRLRMRAPRGTSSCPQCRTKLWIEWNEHVLG